VPVLLDATRKLLTDDEALKEAECVQPAVDASGMTCSSSLPREETMNVLGAKLRELLPRGEKPSVHKGQVMRVGFDRAA